MAGTVNLGRVLPPACRAGSPIITGSLEAMRRGERPGEEEGGEGNEGLDTSGLLSIEVRVFYIGGYGFSCSYMRSPTGVVKTQGWIVGWDVEEFAPAFLHELAILHALAVVWVCLNEGKMRPTLI